MTVPLVSSPAISVRVPLPRKRPGLSRPGLPDRAARQIPAGPFRAWVCQLMSDTGLPWRVISRAAQVPASTVLGLLQEPSRTASLAIRADEAARLLRLDRHRFDYFRRVAADPHQMRVLLWSLAVKGCTIAQLAEFSGITRCDLRHLLAAEDVYCTKLQRLRTEAACEAWGIDPDLVLDPDRVEQGRRAERRHAG